MREKCIRLNIRAKNKSRIIINTSGEKNGVAYNETYASPIGIDGSVEFKVTFLKLSVNVHLLRFSANYILAYVCETMLGTLAHLQMVSKNE